MQLSNLQILEKVKQKIIDHFRKMVNVITVNDVDNYSDVKSTTKESYIEDCISAIEGNTFDLDFIARSAIEKLLKEELKEFDEILTSYDIIRDEKRETIAIDIDDVFLDTYNTIIKQHNITIPENMKKEYWFNKILGISLEETIYLYVNIDPDQVLFHANVFEALYLLQQKYDLYFLTRKTPEMMNWTSRILEKHYLSNIPVIITEDKVSKDHKYDLLIEDYYDTYEQCKKNGRSCYLITRPWNEDKNVDSADRFNSLFDIALKLVRNEIKPETF